MDRTQMLLLGLPLFLFCTDIVNLFVPGPPPPPHKPPPPPHHHHHHHHHNHQQPPLPTKETLDFPSQKPSSFGAIGVGSTLRISFCASCSYKGNAVTVTKMLESEFPGIEVQLMNHPPPLPKRVVSKLVPVAQVGVFGIVMAGEHIFPMVGMVPPPWYYSLRANRFGTIASTWLLGNALQSFLQGTGAFEVYLNDELVFSKLKEGRFPGEIELRDAIASKLGGSRVTDSLGAAALWS